MLHKRKCYIFLQILLDSSNNIEGPFIVVGAETILCSLCPLSCSYFVFCFLKKNTFNISIEIRTFVFYRCSQNGTSDSLILKYCGERKKCDKIGCYMQSLKITWKLQGEGVCRRVPCCDNGDPDRLVTQCDSQRTTWTLWAGKEGRVVEFTTVEGNGL